MMVVVGRRSSGDCVSTRRLGARRCVRLRAASDEVALGRSVEEGGRAMKLGQLHIGRGDPVRLNDRQRGEEP